MQYCDVNSNPRWWTATNTLNVMLVYLSENELIRRMKFGVLNDIGTTIKMTWTKFRFLNSRWRTDAIL